MTANSGRAIEVFTEAIQLPCEERAAFLDRACANDKELRLKIEALLNSNDRAGDFLEQPAATIGKDVVKAMPGEKTGDQIDRYKLLQQIGEGGCGIVFMAEQEKPVRRRVALKILKPGMDTKSVIARFEAERQALALMDHSNIAHVFDAGATGTGRPYFVMELVEGLKITDYCDQHSLSTRVRLELFIHVCDGIQHAHQKGIIHRDIKPSNILVMTGADGKPIPKIIDFGIAKATDGHRLTDKTIFTAREMLIGTPAYMSPEQAALASTEVDTRTDIYSLGVLMYELLTGTTPFNVCELLRAGFDEIRRAVREEEPVRPSTRLTAMSGTDFTRVCQHRHVEPSVLIRQLRGDLDWIVMMALEKDRTRRYKTANGLALDVQRFLTGQPVSARPPSTLYRLQKAVLRHKLLYGAIGTVVVLLIASLIIVSMSLAKERQARLDAEAASVKSQQVTRLLENALGGVSPAVALGQDTTMLRGILDRTSESIGKEITNQPAVEAELRNLIGTLYWQIGNYGRAEEMHRSALAIRRELFGSEDPRVAESLNDLGLELQRERKLAEAEKAFGEALMIRRRVLGSTNAATATSINDLGAVYRDEGRLTEAEALVREALEIRQGLFGQTNLGVADSLRNLSILQGDQKKWAESEATARTVLAIQRERLGPEHPWVASTLDDVAWAAAAQGKTEEAEALQRQALAMRQKLLPPEDPDVLQSLQLVGDSMRRNGNLSGAYSVLSATLSIQYKVLGEDDPASIDTLDDLGLTLAGEGKWSEAETVYRKGLELRRKHSGKESKQALDEMTALGLALENERKWPEAEALYRDSLTLSQKIWGADDRHTLDVMHRLGLTFEGEGKWAEAESMHREALTFWRTKEGENAPESSYAMRKLAEVVEGEGRLAEAENLYREEMASWRQQDGDEDQQTFYARRKLGLTLEAEHKWPEAETVFRESLTLADKKGNQDPEALADLERLVRVLVPQKKYSDAEQLLGEVLTPAFVKQPAALNLLIQRINLLGRQQRWKEALDDATHALELQPADHYRYHTLAGLLAITDDCAAYEHLCKRILATFARTTDCYVAERMAQDCLLLPHSGVDLELVDKLASTAVTVGNNTSDLAYFQACKAMSDFRLGQFQGAIEWGEKAVKGPEPPAQAKAFAVLAMANWQLGQKNEARIALAKGDALVPHISPQAGTVDWGESWVAWLMAQIQLNEAEALINPVSPAVNELNTPPLNR